MPCHTGEHGLHTAVDTPQGLLAGSHLHQLQQVIDLRRVGIEKAARAEHLHASGAINTQQVCAGFPGFIYPFQGGKRDAGSIIVASHAETSADAATYHALLAARHFNYFDTDTLQDFTRQHYIVRLKELGIARILHCRSKFKFVDHLDLAALQLLP